MNFIKTTIYITIALIMICSSRAQNTHREAVIKEIDSLNEQYLFGVTPEDYKNHHYKLKKSKTINYPNGIMMTYMQLIWYHGVKGKLDSTLYYCNTFEQYEQLHHDKELKLSYLINRGILFNSYLGLTEEALNTYTEAYHLVDKDSINEKNSLSTLIAQCYVYKKQYNKAIHILSQSIKDTAVIGLIDKIDLLDCMATTYQFMKQPKKSFPLHTIILKLAQKNKKYKKEVHNQNAIIYDYYLMGNYQKGIEEGLLVRKKIEESDLIEYATNSEFLSNLYQGLGNHEKAIFYMKDAINKTTVYSELPDLYSDLGKYYASNNDLKNALDSYEKKEEVIDSIRSMEQRAFTDYYDMKIKFINQTQDNEKISLKNSRQKSYIISLIVGMACLLLFILSFIIYRKYHKAEKKVEYLQQNEKEILKNHIKVREDELAALLIAQAKKMDHLGDIQKKFKEAVDYDSKNQELTAGYKLLDDFMNNTNSFDLLERLESQYPSIVHQLHSKHKDFSGTDIKHCLLVKLGLSLKESAQLLNVSAETVKKGRNRVIKKLNLPDHVNLRLYLDSFVSA